MESRIQEISTSYNLNCSCFFCILSETVPCVRRAKIARYFKQMPLRDDQEHVLVLSGLWKIAMTKPNDPEFPSLGIFTCMAKLISKGVTDRTWLLMHQNIYIPYYAAHIIGSYTMKKAKFAKKAVKSLVVRPLLELLRGKISWVEQRVALRALCHLASHEATFEVVKAHEVEVIEKAINIASTCLNKVYDEFVGLKKSHRLKYHRNLLTRGLGGFELENTKAEEWASQLQCWSLYLLQCFACRERSLRLICKKRFLKELCGMWGGLSKPSSPCGIGLLETLCHTQVGRESIAGLKEVVESLCHVSRSSDERQHMAIESLMQLLRDPVTRYKVIDTVAPVLADLVELRDIKGKNKVGKAIMQVLLHDYHRMIKVCKLSLKSERTRRRLEELWNLKVERVKREKVMSVQEMREKEALSCVLKQEGSKRFFAGEIEKAVVKYSEALDMCPLKLRKERIVLHSNRAQCHLLLKDAEAAISDATRALCLSGVARPHSKSLWRRSQAYDMKGLAKESLMDCLTFISTKGFKIPFYAARIFNKQMNSTSLFSSARSKWRSNHEEMKEFVMDRSRNRIGVMNLSQKTRRKMKGKSYIIVEEPFSGRRAWERRKCGRRSEGRKLVSET
ncbi:Tetratricopeptide repeat protein 1, partial [Mucuna pruriens]